MTPEQFCYWLQGRCELLPKQRPSEAEWAVIREHLALVFRKVTPSTPTPYSTPPVPGFLQRGGILDVVC